MSQPADTRRTRYTDFAIMVDTHTKPLDADDEMRLAQLLLGAIRQFATPAALNEVLLVETPNRLKGFDLTNASIEVGGKFGRLHAHFNLSIRHETKVLLKSPDGRNINSQIQQWFDGKLEPVTGRKCNARAILDDTSRFKNYATKHGQSVDNVRVDNTAGGATSKDK